MQMTDSKLPSMCYPALRLSFKLQIVLSHFLLPTKESDVRWRKRDVNSDQQCWSNMNQDSVAALCISHFSVFKKYILVHVKASTKKGSHWCISQKKKKKGHKHTNKLLGSVNGKETSHVSSVWVSENMMWSMLAGAAKQTKGREAEVDVVRLAEREWNSQKGRYEQTTLPAPPTSKSHFLQNKQGVGEVVTCKA